MRRIAILSALAFGIAGPAAAADITGVWLAPARSAHVEIAKCGETVCGKVLSATPARTNPLLLDVNNKHPELRSRPMIGRTLMDGFIGGPVKWTGGWLYNPDDGNTYHGALTLLDPDHLQVKGCALVILCKSQTWTQLS